MLTTLLCTSVARAQLLQVHAWSGPSSLGAAVIPSAGRKPTTLLTLGTEFYSAYELSLFFVDQKVNETQKGNLWSLRREKLVS